MMNATTEREHANLQIEKNEFDRQVEPTHWRGWDDIRNGTVFMGETEVEISDSSEPVGDQNAGESM